MPLGAKEIIFGNEELEKAIISGNMPYSRLDSILPCYELVETIPDISSREDGIRYIDDETLYEEVVLADAYRAVFGCEQAFITDAPVSFDSNLIYMARYDRNDEKISVSDRARDRMGHNILASARVIGHEDHHASFNSILKIYQPIEGDTSNIDELDEGFAHALIGHYGFDYGKDMLQRYSSDMDIESLMSCKDISAMLIDISGIDVAKALLLCSLEQALEEMTEPIMTYYKDYCIFRNHYMGLDEDKKYAFLTRFQSEMIDRLR